MAKKKKVSSPEDIKSDQDKINEWMGKNKITQVANNVTGECVVKSFFARRKKHPFKKDSPPPVITKNEEPKKE